MCWRERIGSSSEAHDAKRGCDPSNEAANEESCREKGGPEKSSKEGRLKKERFKEEFKAEIAGKHRALPL